MSDKDSFRFNVTGPYVSICMVLSSAEELDRIFLPYLSLSDAFIRWLRHWHGPGVLGKIRPHQVNRLLPKKKKSKRSEEANENPLCYTLM
jgi:hypothetical protein